MEYKELFEAFSVRLKDLLSLARRGGLRALQLHLVARLFLQLLGAFIVKPRRLSGWLAENNRGNIWMQTMRRFSLHLMMIN